VIVPNLSSRPLINARPVWLLTAVAGFLTVVLLIVNIQMYRSSNRHLAARLETRDQLDGERSRLEQQVQAGIKALDGVAWRGLEAQVTELNLILREHNFSWSAMLRDIERVMPYEVRLTQIGPRVSTEGVTLGLEGVAKTRDAMLVFMENLIADPSFEEPLPRAETGPEEANTPGYVFTLSVTYRPPGWEDDPEEES